MIKKILILTALKLSINLTAFASPSNITSNMLVKSHPLLNSFDGTTFKINNQRINSGQVLSYLKAQGYSKVSTSSFDNTSQGGQIQFGPDFEKYSLHWDLVKLSKELISPDEKTSQYRRVSQVLSQQDPKHIKLSTIVYRDDDSVKIKTECQSLNQNDNSTIFCATATAEVCHKVLNISRNQKPFSKNFNQLKNEANKCTETISEFNNVVKAFQNDDGLNRSRSLLASNERDAVTLTLKKSGLNSNSWNSYFKKDNIKFISNDSREDMENISQSLTSTMTGIRYISQLIDLCESSSDQFTPKGAAKIIDLYPSPNNSLQKMNPAKSRN